MRERQQNSTTHPINFLMVLSSDHISPATGKTPTVVISKDGGSFATPSGTITEIGNGWYSLSANATDRNTLGSFLLNATSSGCDPSDRDYTIVGYDPFNSTNLGLSSIPNVSQGSAGALITSGTGTAQIALSSGNVSSNVVQWGGITVTGMPLPTTSFIAPDNTDIVSLLTSIGSNLHTDVSAIKNKTDNLPASPAAIGSAMTLSSTGFDNIVIETGVNPRQALSAIFAAAAGVISGADTNSIVIKGGNVSTTRIAADTDGSGNRTSVILTLPT